MPRASDRQYIYCTQPPHAEVTKLLCPHHEGAGSPHPIRVEGPDLWYQIALVDTAKTRKITLKKGIFFSGVPAAFQKHLVRVPLEKLGARSSEESFQFISSFSGLSRTPFFVYQRLMK